MTDYIETDEETQVEETETEETQTEEDKIAEMTSEEFKEYMQSRLNPENDESGSYEETETESEEELETDAEDAEESSEETDEESDDEGTTEDIEDTDEDEKQDEEDAKQPEKDFVPPKKPELIEVKANGRTLTFTEEERNAKFAEFAQKAIDYTKKMQEIAPHRKKIDAMEQANITQDELNLFIDAKQGKPGALHALLKSTGVNIEDIDEDNEEVQNYTPSDYGRDARALAVKEVIETIVNEEHYPKTRQIVQDEWDSTSWEILQNNPEFISGLHEDVKSGRYDVIQAHADKLKLLDGNKHSDFDYYSAAAGEYNKSLETQQKTEQFQGRFSENIRKFKEAQAEKQKEIEQIKIQTEKRNNVRNNADKRKEATIPKGKPSVAQTQIDYMAMSKEDFEKEYERIMGRSY